MSRSADDLRGHCVFVTSETGWAQEVLIVLACSCGWAKQMGTYADFERLSTCANAHIVDVIRRQSGAPPHPETN